MGYPSLMNRYNRTRSTLDGKYGKPSKVANAHIQGTMNFPYFRNDDSYKIHGSY